MDESTRGFDTRHSLNPGSISGNVFSPRLCFETLTPRTTSPLTRNSSPEGPPPLTTRLGTPCVPNPPKPSPVRLPRYDPKYRSTSIPVVTLFARSSLSDPSVPPEVNSRVLPQSRQGTTGPGAPVVDVNRRPGVYTGKGPGERTSSWKCFSSLGVPTPVSVGVAVMTGGIREKHHDDDPTDKRGHMDCRPQ